MPDETKDTSTPPEPLNETWWVREEPDDFPPDDVPLLAPYEKTSPGFELGVIAGSWGQSKHFQETADGYYQFCLWKIWERKKDPADEDKEKQKINEMQRGLGELSDDDRYIRIQIACLARCFWTFPTNVNLVLDGIASGTVNLDAGISCEPPWTGMRQILLRRRGRPDVPPERRVAWAHHQQGIEPWEDQRCRLIRIYARILTWWSVEGHVEYLKLELPTHADLAETIYRRLGAPTKLKCLYVQKLCWHLNHWGIPGLPGEGRRKRNAEFEGVYDAAIREELGEQEDKIGKLIDRNNDNGSCHHAFFRHVDHIIAHIGAGKPVILPGAGEERKRVHDTIVDYVHVLGSWVAGRPLEEAISIWPLCDETARRLYDVLGSPTPRIRWLVACLWKKLQEDRAHKGRGALDEQPERFALSPEALRV